MPKHDTPYLSIAGLTRIAFIVGAVYFVYVMGGYSLLLGSGWAATMKLTGAAPDCAWPQILRFYTDLDAFDATYRSYQDQVEVLEQDPELPLERVRTVKGDMWIRYTRAGRGIGYILAEHDWLERLAPNKVVQEGDVVVDVGAHVGLFTRKALDRGAARVIAIEPDPNSLECLRRNFAEEIEDGRVTLVAAGAWNETGTMTLSLGDSPGWNSLVEEMSDESVEVPVRTIDAILEELDVDRVSFIKMDIEGAEPQALEGSRATLEKYHPTVMIDSYTWPGNLTPLDDLLRDADPTYDRVCGPCEPNQAWDMVIPHVIFYNTPEGRV